MHIIIHTSTLLTDDQIAGLRIAVRAQLDDDKKVIVLPPGCTIEMLPSVPTGVFCTTSAIVDEAVIRYQTTVKKLGYPDESAIPAPPPPSDTRLMRRCWPERFWLSYMGWRKDLGVLAALRAAWRISR